MASLPTIIRRSSSFAHIVRNLTSIRSITNPCLFISLNRSSIQDDNHRYFSTAKKIARPSSDESLLHVIQSEIECAVQSEEPNHDDEIPEGFLFEVQDNPGQQTVILTREYEGEDIKVEVHMSNLTTGDEDNSNDDDNANNENGNQSSLPMVVNVVRKNGGPSLEFGVTAFADEIVIDSLSIKNPDNFEDQIPYDGPDFSSLDENLQKAFHKYLEIRGIKPSTTNFLHEYMINKDSREYLVWLNKVKDFIQK